VKENLCEHWNFEFICISRETNQESDWNMQKDCEHYVKNDDSCDCLSWEARYRCSSKNAQRDARVIIEMGKI